MKGPREAPALRRNTMYPERQADAKDCFFCDRKTREFPIDAQFGLCWEHRTKRDIRSVSKVRRQRELNAALEGRPRRRPWGRKIHSGITE